MSKEQIGKARINCAGALAIALPLSLAVGEEGAEKPTHIADSARASSRGFGYPELSPGLAIGAKQGRLSSYHCRDAGPARFMRPFIYLFQNCAALSLLLVVVMSHSTAQAEEVRFNRDIRPILSDNCFFCHGPDEETREADLRLDLREEALRDLGGYAGIVPGKPEESEIILRIEDHDDLMPPPKSNKVLTSDQISLLRQWIEQGAKYEPHWSFMPVKKPAPPLVKKQEWTRNEIDTFVLAKLEESGIEPSPAADSRTLIRRLYVDLLGLLPPPEEVDRFLKDRSPEAYEDLVEQLLASPHYGERWGRHWLDQARYADSNGYSIDSERQMWPYRDWVIHALNRDLPFDQFTIEQIAGDLLENPGKDQLIATGFHRNTLINQEGGTDREQFRVEAAVDRINTTGAVWLGLTLGCAQCHTHKFDPIPHREYFEMYAFFNSGTDQNSKGKTIPVVKGEVFGNPITIDRPKNMPTAERGKLFAEWQKAKKKQLADQLGENEKVPAVWKKAKPISAQTASGSEVSITEESAFFLQAGYQVRDSIQVEVETDLAKIAAIRLKVMPHPKLPKNGPGSAGNGNFVLTRFEAPASIASAFADHEQPGYPIAGAIDKNPKTGWAINVAKNEKKAKMNAPHEATFILAQSLSHQPGTVLRFTLHHELNDNYLVGHFAIELSDKVPSRPAHEQQRLQNLFSILQKSEKARTKNESELIDQNFVLDHPQAKIVKHTPGPNEANVMIMEDLPSPRTTYLLTRGDFTRPNKELGPLHPGGLSSVAPALPAQKGRSRLDLAHWLIDSKNPLTPRVTLNRIWMRYFGKGLVETEEDFGTQGSLPSHPDLLDWLAGSFIESGWSMKHMHRLIVTSATYRQSSYARPDLDTIDPRNLLLARQNRLRFDAEIVRDAALDASGLLYREIGGPGVYPPQPDGVYAFTQNSKKWNTEKGENRYRRAMYTMFFRSAPYPLFTTFDAPDFSSVCTRRVKSNTPLQALNLANDPAFVEFARAMAERLITESPGSIEKQIRYAFEISLSRPPSPTEADTLLGYFQSVEHAYRDDLESAKALTGESLTSKIPDHAHAAALVSLTRVLFNTDNFITRE